MNQRILKESAILFIITLVAGLALGFVYGITKKPIEDANAKAKIEAYQSVFPGAENFAKDSSIDLNKAPEILTQAGVTGTTIQEVLVAQDASGTALGYVMNVTNANGYAGDINFSVGIKADGTLNSYSILEISETAGLGMKAKEDKFSSQYKDKKVDQFEVTKSGAAADNQIDAISGATITSKAITNGVNGALAFFKTLEGGTAQ